MVMGGGGGGGCADEWLPPWLPLALVFTICYRNFSNQSTVLMHPFNLNIW
jgi:hypothetical protein